jgi:hypothetical protein
LVLNTLELNPKNKKIGPKINPKPKNRQKLILKPKNLSKSNPKPKNLPNFQKSNSVVTLYDGKEVLIKIKWPNNFYKIFKKSSPKTFRL